MNFKNNNMQSKFPDQGKPKVSQILNWGQSITLLALTGNSNTGKDSIGRLIKQLTVHTLEPKISKSFIYDMFNPSKPKLLCDIMDGYKSYGKTIWKNKKFADKSKQRLTIDFPKEFNILRWEREGDDYREGVMKSFNKTRRQVLQDYCESICSFYPNYHIDALFNSRKSNHEYDKWYITDTRKPNECDRIIEEGGILINVVKDIDKSNEKYQHISETALKDYNKYHYTIDNNGTRLETLLQLTKILLELNVITEDFRQFTK